MFKKNTIQIQGEGGIAGGKLEQKRGQLTDSDLRYIEGRAEELIGRLQQQTGETKETVSRFIGKCFKA